MCRPNGTLVLAWLVLAGAQGRSVYGQQVLYAPSWVADVVSCEMTMEMEQSEMDELLPALIRAGVAAVSPNGVLGDPAGASAEEGERLLAGMVDNLRSRLARWAPAARGRLA